MKKTWIVPFVISLLFFGISQAALVDDAVSWAYTNNLTIHKTSKDFKVDQNIRRDEAAKFFVNFAKLVGKNIYVKTDSECKFSDIDQSWSDLKNVVVEACKLWIFQWSKGKFNPSGFLTQEQAVAVLIRIIDGYSPEIWGKWSDLYYSRLQKLDLEKWFNPSSYRNQFINRWYVINIIYNARGMKWVNSKYKITQDKEYLNNYDGRYDDYSQPSFCEDKNIIDKYKNNTLVKKSADGDLLFWSWWELFGRTSVKIWWLGRRPTDFANVLALNFYDTKKDVSKCDSLSDLYNQIINWNYKIMDVKNEWMDYIIPNSNGSIDSMSYLSLKDYFSSCEENLKKVAVVEYTCDVLQNKSISFDDFIHPVKELIDGSFKKDPAKISYRSWYIYYNWNDGGTLIYRVLDSKYIYEFKTSDILDINSSYEWRLVGTVQKSDGTYPKLKYFWNEIYSENAIKSYIEDLLMWKQSSNYFNSQLDLFKSDIDNLYK